MKKPHNTILPLMVAILSLVMYSGCGDGLDLVSVSGTVTINGDPYPDIYVAFQPASGDRPSTGVTDEQGKYSLKFSRDRMGMYKGPCVVTLEKRHGGGEGAQYLPPEYNAEASENPEMNIVVEKKGTFDFDVVMEPAELEKYLKIEAETPDYNDTI